MLALVVQGVMQDPKPPASRPKLSRRDSASRLSEMAHW